MRLLDLVNPRRATLAAVSAACGLTLTAGSASAVPPAGRAAGPLQAVQKVLAARKLDRVKHIVVIYQENHSFDNLYGGWEGVDGLASADPAHTIQVDQAGAPYACLKQNDPSLTSPPLSVTCTDPVHVIASDFFNAPFRIDDFIPPTAATCPNGAPGGMPGGCTRDLVHRFYQEQYQIDGGRQDRYVTGSDAVGLTMGTYDTTQLPIYKYLHGAGHPAYAISENFFQAAFGGSFLNHQWLIAAATPTFPNAPNDGGANDLHAVVDANGMPANYPLYTSPLGSAVKDPGLTASCRPPNGRAATPPGAQCGDYAVNTIQPPYAPYAPGTPVARRLPPQTGKTVGDELSAHGVDWAWYAGGWSNANGDVGAPGWTNGTGPQCADAATATGASYPNCPDRLFQFHHQPFNYYAAYAPGTAARAQHLRDEQQFLASAAGSTRRCGLKPVSFIKPIGAENEHPGYTGETQGSSHLVNLLTAISSSRCARDTMVVVTYDEFGGQWDHVSPPGQGGTAGPHDAWGPGTRIPALVLAPHLRGAFVVDKAEHDTTSILTTIEHRFGLAPLGPRDAAVPDLSTVFAARSPGAAGVPKWNTGPDPGLEFPVEGPCQQIASGLADPTARRAALRACLDGAAGATATAEQAARDACLRAAGQINNPTVSKQVQASCPAAS